MRENGEAARQEVSERRRDRGNQTQSEREREGGGQSEDVIMRREGKNEKIINPLSCESASS